MRVTLDHDELCDAIIQYVDRKRLFPGGTPVKIEFQMVRRTIVTHLTSVNNTENAQLLDELTKEAQANGGVWVIDKEQSFVVDEMFRILRASVEENWDSPDKEWTRRTGYWFTNGPRIELEFKLAHVPGPKPRPLENPPTLRGDKTLSDLVIEQRDE
jgi:hypothetical protein